MISAAYPYKICCKDAGNSCSGNYKTILKLSSPTNAHVEEYQLTPQNYNYDVCLSAAGSVTCSYRQNCTSNELCVVSIYQATNAHVGSCGYYNINVCCEICENKITMKCATVKNPPGETKPEIESCSEDVNDKACCPSPEDCVANGVCYTDDGRSNTTEWNGLNCDNGVWCPSYFRYSSSENKCIYEPLEKCYDPSDPNMCQYEYNTKDWWESDKCVDKVNKKCCCIVGELTNGAQYYSKKDIIVY